jgi:acyl carrier protein
VTPEELRPAVLKALHRVAPEADLESLDPSQDLRDALDIDSIGILQFATGIAQEAGIEVPERDYARITTLAGCLEYLAAAARPA